MGISRVNFKAHTPTQDTHTHTLNWPTCWLWAAKFRLLFSPRCLGFIFGFGFGFAKCLLCLEKERARARLAAVAGASVWHQLATASAAESQSKCLIVLVDVGVDEDVEESCSHMIWCAHTFRRESFALQSKISFIYILYIKSRNIVLIITSWLHI